MDLSINQRLREYIEAKKISQESFRITIGVAKKQQLSSWLTNGEKIPEKYLIEAIRKYQDLNPSWLLLGNGPMSNDSNTSSQLQVNDNCIECAMLRREIEIVSEERNRMRQEYKEDLNELREQYNKIAAENVELRFLLEGRKISTA